VVGRPVEVGAVRPQNLVLAAVDAHPEVAGVDRPAEVEAVLVPYSPHSCVAW